MRASACAFAGTTRVLRTSSPIVAILGDAMIKVVYPGTFDPFTRGHEDLVRRAAHVFDHVVVAVADSEAKHPFFTAAERVEMARDVVRPIANAEVMGFSSLLMDFVH